MTDNSWRLLAQSSRQCLDLLGYSIKPLCLPDEPDACGGTFAQHTAAHLATLLAVIHHQLEHLNAAEWLPPATYSNILGELRKECQAGSHGDTVHISLRCRLLAGEPHSPCSGTCDGHGSGKFCPIQCECLCHIISRRPSS